MNETEFIAEMELLRQRVAAAARSEWRSSKVHVIQVADQMLLNLGVAWPAGLRKNRDVLEYIAEHVCRKAGSFLQWRWPETPAEPGRPERYIELSITGKASEEARS